MFRFFFAHYTIYRLKRFVLVAAVLLVTLRMCHVQILWEGDTLPLAAAGQMLTGKALYRDIWFDKPPLTALFYLLCGGQAGWPLRLIGALYVLLACWLAYGFARRLWTEREGLWAAGLLGFFLTFDFPSAVIPVASDLLMLASHIAAVWLAFERRPFWSGVVAGVAFWINPKGVFVAAACVLWYPAGALWMAAGFAVVSAAFVAWLFGSGALWAYWDQVWRWGRLYAGSTFIDSPLKNGLVRTLSWMFFHAAIVVSAVVALWRDKRRAWIGWLAVSFVGVSMGLRFFPRYYFLFLPPIVLLGGACFSLPKAREGQAKACPTWLAVLLLIPLIRFGPSYWAAVYEPTWRDIQMDRASRAAAAFVVPLAKPGDTLFVW